MIKHIARTAFISAFLLSTLSLTNISAAATETKNEQAAPATDNKRDNPSDTIISIAELGKLTERWLKIKVLVGERADYKIHMNLSKEPLSYSQLLTQLNINGLTAYKSNDYIQIIPTRDARIVSIPIAEKHKIYLEDEYVTDFIKPEKACATRLLSALRPMVPQYGFLSVYEDANTLLIVDTYGNIQRIKAAIQAIDKGLTAPESCTFKNK